MQAGFNQLRRGGMLTLVGAGIEPPSFDPNRMILNELQRLRVVHLRRRRLRTGPRAPGLGRAADRSAHRSCRRDRSTCLATRWRAWPRDASPARRWSCRACRRNRLTRRTRTRRHDAPVLSRRQPTPQPRGDEPARRPARRGATGPTSSATSTTCSGSTSSTCSPRIGTAWSSAASTGSSSSSSSPRTTRCVARAWTTSGSRSAPGPSSTAFGSVRSRFREKDKRVDIIDPAVDDQGVVKIHSIYLGYLLPMMCEVQYWEFTS